MGRLELLLLRVQDGVATSAEQREFEALGGSDAAQEWASIRAQLRAAVDAPVDVGPEVLAALEEPAWASALREAVAGPVDVTDAVMSELDEPAWGADLKALLAEPVDVVDAVLSEIDTLPARELMAYGDGETAPALRAATAGRLLRDAEARAALTAQAELGAELRSAVARGGELDVWNEVAAAIGADPHHVEGWEATASELRRAVAVPVDVAPAVMAAVDPARRSLPRWASLGAPLGLMAAAAAALLAVVFTGPVDGARVGGALVTTPAVPPVVVAELALAAVNDVQVEDIQTTGDMVAQVVQFDDGGPTFIILDDPDGAHDVGSPGASL